MSTSALALAYGAEPGLDPKAALAAEVQDEPFSCTAGPLALACIRRPVEPAGGRALCAYAGSLYSWDRVATNAEIDPELGPCEVLARAYVRIGERVLDELRGDFLLLLYDHTSDRGLVARDHMGGLPGYWAAQGGGIVAASDPRTLLAMLRTRPGPDPAAMACWLGAQGIPGELSMYSGVRRIEAGSMIRLQQGATRAERYWEPTYARPVSRPRAELVAGLADRLETAVRRRSAPSAGLLLSGGLDSSSVAAFCTTLADERRPRRAYSAVFPSHPSVDESELIGRLASRFDLGRTQAVVRGGSVVGGSLGYLERFEIPPISPNLFFWNPLLAQAHDDGVTALLDGEGGDELFGLSFMLVADRLRHGRLPSIRRLIRRMPGFEAGVSRSAALSVWKSAARGAMPVGMHHVLRRIRNLEHADPLLLPAARDALLSTFDELGWKRVAGPRWFARLVDSVTRGMGSAWAYEHVALRARMAGVEARHPLVDPDVVEYVLGLPPEAAWDPSHSRPLLREATAGVLPDEVRLRTAKSTFDAIFHDGLEGPDRPLLDAMFGPDALIGEFVDVSAMRRELLEPTPPRATYPRAIWALRLWRMATGELFLRFQSDAGAPRRLVNSAAPAPPDVDIVTDATN